MAGEDTAELLRRRSANINKFWGHLQKLGPHASLPPPERLAARRSGSCTLRECEGVDLLAQVKADFEPWRRRGGVSRADTEAAQKKGCAFGEEDGHFFDCIQGWVRVMVVNNTLWATHFGEGFGSRDGVFLVAMLELLARHKVRLSRKRGVAPHARAHLLHFRPRLDASGSMLSAREASGRVLSAL
jgi:hypothetical protein